jgi:hypothetical protein
VGPVAGWAVGPTLSLPWVSLVVTLPKWRWNGIGGLESVEAALDGRLSKVGNCS